MRQLGEYLQQKRRDKSVRLEDVAHVTRIPERSLRHLEAGEVDKLPGEVFVRGFVRAYAECIGIDPQEAMRVYNRAAHDDRAGHDEARAGVDEERDADVVVVEPVKPTPEESPSRSFFLPSLRGEEESKRGPVTLAVIILVIVATLTMSYLLRTPSSSGDGITRAGDTPGQVG